ncbi:hypothetical protein Hanom_Chr06g00566371 [Helianthus anomalus]
MLNFPVKYDMCLAHEDKLVILLVFFKHVFFFLSFSQPHNLKPYPFFSLLSHVSLSLSRKRLATTLVAKPRRQRGMAVVLRMSSKKPSTVAHQILENGRQHGMAVVFSL